MFRRNRISFMIFAIFAVPVFWNTAEAQLAVQSSNFGAYNNSWMQLAQNPQVQQELEIVPEQLEKLKKLNQEYYAAYRELVKEVQPAGKPFDALAREELTERNLGLREKLAENVTKALLPHQIKRLKEIAVQNSVKRGAYGFRDPQLMKLLEIDEEQLKKLQARSTELQKELMEKYKQLQKEANEKLLEEFTPSQRAKLKELTGEPYNPPPFDWRKYNADRQAKAAKAKADAAKAKADAGKAKADASANSQKSLPQ